MTALAMVTALWRFLFLLIPMKVSAECFQNFHDHVIFWRDSSAATVQHWSGWTVARRSGKPNICRGTLGAAYFLVALKYLEVDGDNEDEKQLSFAVCAPHDCSEGQVAWQLLPLLLPEFFRAHPDLQFHSHAVRFSGLSWASLTPLAFFAAPALIFSLWEILSNSRCDLSLRASWKCLLRPPREHDKRASLVRVAATTALLLLHITEGTPWDEHTWLSQHHWWFVVVRPLNLVNQVFIILSCHLLTSKLGLSVLGGLRVLLRKSLRQMPLYLFWTVVYVRLTPLLPRDEFNQFGFFGQRWSTHVQRCSEAWWRYCLVWPNLARRLMGQTAADEDVRGNPCFNLWVFDTEFACTVVVVGLLVCRRLLGRWHVAATLAVLAVCVKDVFDSWTCYFLAPATLHLLICDVPWRRPRVAFGVALGLGLLLTTWLLDLCIWRHGNHPYLVGCSDVVRPLAASGLARCLYQLPMVLGLNVLITAPAVGPKDRRESSNASTPCTGDAVDAQASSIDWLWVLGRLCFGINLAHGFVHFYVAAHAHALRAPRFSWFALLGEVLSVACVSLAAALCVALFLQLPAERCFSYVGL